uniref:Uncharacterized protein n=1 Tax=Arundo donax TaxID=35708 RepID=A0A0A8Y1Q3_ARUDO
MSWRLTRKRLANSVYVYAVSCGVRRKHEIELDLSPIQVLCRPCVEIKRSNKGTTGAVQKANQGATTARGSRG